MLTFPAVRPQTNTEEHRDEHRDEHRAPGFHIRRVGVALITICVLLCSSVAAVAQLSTRVHASGFSSPLGFVQDPVSANVQYVLEQGGRIRVVRDGVVLPADFLNLTSQILSGGERGLLGMAFDPNYAGNGRFYVNFTNLNGDTVVARFRRSSSDPLVADAASRFNFRFNGASAQPPIVQPFANHNGGHLAFGPDGYLYIGLGDGGSANDPEHRAQNPSTLLGKMLRIDVNVPDSHPIGYAIPPDNPFVNAAGTRGEIWAFGLRNPWRYGFDDPARGGSGALIIADVGQGAWEEVDYEPPGRGGRNYGWRNREGAHNNVTTLPPAYQPLVDPIHEYDHSVGASITGGYVYRGQALGAAFRGRYFFADFVRSRVWSLALTVDANGEARATNVIEHTADLGGSATLSGPSSFGVDASGELYIVSHSRGVVLKIVGPVQTPPVPTGLRIIR
jgi:glucose/arabinose dehydrogenase